jgi:hypothetical protein
MDGVPEEHRILREEGGDMDAASKRLKANNGAAAAAPGAAALLAPGFPLAPVLAPVSAPPAVPYSMPAVQPPYMYPGYVAYQNPYAYYPAAAG